MLRRETKYSPVGFKKRSKHKQMRAWLSFATDSMTTCSSSRKDSNRITYRLEHISKNPRRRLWALSKILVMSVRPFWKVDLRPLQCKASRKSYQGSTNSTVKQKHSRIKLPQTKTSLLSSNREVDNLKSSNQPLLQLPPKSSQNKSACNYKKMLSNVSRLSRNGPCST